MSVAFELGNGVTIGDEIAVYDGDVCVGAAIVSNEDLIVIPVSMDDPLTENTDGYLEGNTISVQVWSERSGILYENVLTEHLSGSETYAALDTYAGSLQLTLTGFSSASNSGEVNVEVYPNPFNENAVISYNLPSSGKVSIEIFNMHGKLMKMISNEYHVAGQHSVHLNRENFKAGTYLLNFKVEGNDRHSEMKKVIIY